MRSRSSRLLTLAAGAGIVTYAAYRKDMLTARQRIEIDKQLIESPDGPIEFAEAGDGPAVLVIHGAGGGFDQGLALGRSFVGDNHRIIAPSRFGYLGTPLPDDASPEAQADAHARLLDTLKLDRVPVIGVSAGAPSAMQFCLRHPDRCSALVLIVPLAYAPDHDRLRLPARSRIFGAVLNAIVTSDFLFWTGTKVARSTLVKTILGTPVGCYARATRDERAGVDQMLDLVLPISVRAAGIENDAAIGSTLTRYELEQIHVPTLVASAADDGYGTYDSALYTAEEIHRGEFIGFPTGGHLLVGHEEELRSEIANFLEQSAQPESMKAETRLRFRR